jgi:pyruvate,water dikinase
VAALPREDLSAAVARFEAALPRFADEVAAQIVASTISTLFFGRLQQLLARVDRSDLELELLGGFGETEEIRVSSDLWRVARGELELAGFLEQHGFRGPSDGELSSHSWREDPGPIEALLAPYRALPEERSPMRVERDRRDARERAARALLSGLRGRERASARMLLAFGRRYIPLRVIAKAAFQQTFDVARAAARRIGALHATAGRLESPEDVFFLTRDELREPPGDARDRVLERRRTRERFRELELPLEFTGMPVPTARHSAKSDDGTMLRGLGASPGVVEGPARVVLEPGDGELLSGEILVCHTTDPSWSAYFLLAAGVVIDIGGTLSHGAIVARELGIPCVINTVDGSQRIRTGDRLRVDGGSGRVERLA